MENTNDKRLSFPQRNWFLLCVIVAVLSPLVVHLLHAGARKHVYDQETEVRDTAQNTGPGSNDTANKVASPPTNRPAGAAAKPGGAGAAPVSGATGDAGSGDSASKKTGRGAAGVH
jgi:hypothetical protein